MFGAIRRTTDVEAIAGVRLIHEANRRFHDGIIAAARHRRLATMLVRTVDIPLVFQAFRTFGTAEIERSDTFHRLIAEAMVRRDTMRAAALMAEHIAQGRDAVLDAMAVAEETERPAHDGRHRTPQAVSRAVRRGRAGRRRRRSTPATRPDMTMWINFTGETIDPRGEPRRASTRAAGLHRRRTYNDRNINTFDDGFVVQYTINVVAHNGTEVALSACVVAEVRDGQITKLFEYLDAGKFRPARR